MIKKKNPTVPESRIKAALWATDGSAGMAKTMLALPWKCARCARDDDAVEPARKGWYLVMNAWICQTCADEGWAPGPLSPLGPGPFRPRCIQFGPWCPVMLVCVAQIGKNYVLNPIGK